MSSYLYLMLDDLKLIVYFLPLELSKMSSDKHGIKLLKLSLSKDKD